MTFAVELTGYYISRISQSIVPCTCTGKVPVSRWLTQVLRNWLGDILTTEWWACLSVEVARSPGPVLVSVQSQLWAATWFTVQTLTQLKLCLKDDRSHKTTNSPGTDLRKTVPEGKQKSQKTQTVQELPQLKLCLKEERSKTTTTTTTTKQQRTFQVLTHLKLGLNEDGSHTTTNSPGTDPVETRPEEKSTWSHTFSVFFHILKF